MFRCVRRGLVGITLALALSPIAAAGPKQEPVARGAELFRIHGCYGCHLVGAFGTPIGPDLSRVGARFSKEALVRWLLDPQSQRPRAHMPRLELDPVEAEALAVWLSTLR